MSLFRSKTILALVAAGTLLATTPAFAFVAVTCTAKNSRGTKFTNEYFGLFQVDSRMSARSYAMAECKAKSSNPDSCKVTTCRVTHH